MDTSFLCAELNEILGEEITLGNEISNVVKVGWTKIDVIVYLKFPFRKNYQNRFKSADVTFFRHEDPHYDREDSYSSAIYWQALAAPIS
ncbi:MAG: hypothetical protein M3T96_03785 [Acidobacteriota bacterium]|nr:hypothetical protein [Acidobacteriota bacterium]